MKKIFYTILSLALAVFTAWPARAAEVACKTSALQSLNLTPYAVVCGAAVDAINPCALSILILLMASMLINGERKKALLTGFSFIAAVYFSYFLMGIGALTIIRSHTLVYSDYFYKIVGGAAIIFGLLNIKDYVWYGGGGFIMEVPRKWRPKMKTMIKKITTPGGAFLVGLVVSLFLLPCLSGPYVVILGMLAAKASFWKGFLYMIVYNLVFVLPMSAVVLAMYFGLPPAKAEAWRQKKLRFLHLVAGTVLLLLGAVILLGLL